MTDDVWDVFLCAAGNPQRPKRLPFVYFIKKSGSYVKQTNFPRYC